MSKRSRKVSKKKSQKENNENSIKIANELSDNQIFRKEEYSMLFTDYRLKTFTDWPFDEDNSCNPYALASAGFYHIPTNEEPDATRCFCCYKDLDGWEPDDNPWEEHRKHSPHCAFLSLNKSVEKLTVDEFLKLECERQKNKLKKLFHIKIDELKHHGKNVRMEMAKINK
ncbi:baculoviral IAP repeat-containing protein 5-like [Ruditapes philippinarum]|uniref:baculoviral IAP repeat-containing protein 5-like n=1 Tax=Ruditapes philippinarum TaxID=129788 RepID=UPI00295AA994|nr:baculoviral IAP repeat-containing protein 5-like [Ruditapes philippinarum]